MATDESGRVVGFVTAYVRPGRPDTLMAWQSAVAPDINAPGPAVRMMLELADRAAGRGATCVETTVNPGNRPVALMLRSPSSPSAAVAAGMRWAVPSGKT